jgi:hypothetical protein
MFLFQNRRDGNLPGYEGCKLYLVDTGETSMKYKNKIAPWLIGAVGLAVVLPLTAFHQDANPRATITPCDLRSDLRKLWEDHVTWTRLYVVSALADAPDKEATAARLMRNQVDLGKAIEPFYGETPAAKLTALLKTHITILTQIIDAAKSGNEAKKDEAMKRWQENGDEIAAFLSEANPEHWPKAHMRQMVREHLDATAAGVAARVKKDWNADIEAYDKIHSQALVMSDMLAAGITAKFPQKVR